MEEFLRDTAIPKDFVNPTPLRLDDLKRKVQDIDLAPTVAPEDLLKSVNRNQAGTHQGREAAGRAQGVPLHVEAAGQALHGTRIPLYWFPLPG